MIFLSEKILPYLISFFGFVELVKKDTFKDIEGSDLGIFFNIFIKYEQAK
jgi:hypothetical protein